MDEAFREQFLKGIELFNQRQFYECHDTLEEIWLQESSDEQPFLQGMIQSAVAFHHYSQGKRGAARAMFKLALEKLETYPAHYQGLDLGVLVQDLRAWKEALDHAISSQSTDPLPNEVPKIQFL